MTVADVCTRHVVIADQDETVVEAARRMRAAHVGDVVVADSQQRPVGMLTDRDIVVSAVAQSPDSISSLSIRDVMTRDIVTIHGFEPFEDAVSLMRHHGIRRLPVVGSDGRVEGILTLDDVLRQLATEAGKLVGLVALEQRRERAVRTG